MDYIADFDLEAANRFIDTLHAKFVLIGKGLKLGSARPEMGEHVRMWPHGNYIVYFEAIGNVAIILRVIHSGRDQTQAFSTEFEN
jgi:plasmid stabilization system protein ParE